METACLRIKFIPLIKETIKNNSKCYLEIVPNVSCIQNLDKLIWKNEKIFIEYTVPVTHKIILRKHNIKDISEEIEKTYHSCVDLLVCQSETNHNIGSGDMSKIISDTFILAKLPNQLSKTENASNLLTNDNKAFTIVQHNVSDNNAPLEIVDSAANSTNQTEVDVFNKDLIHLEKTEKDTQYYTDGTLSNETYSDKSVNTDPHYPIFTNFMNTRYPTKLSNSCEAKLKLSLSPICSVNTHESTGLCNTSSSKYATYPISDSQNKLEPLSYESNGNQLNYIISQYGWLSGQNSIRSIHLTSSYRSPPEIRIAQYIHHIEKELLPLNVVLDELLRKCSVLGIGRLSSSEINPSRNNSLCCRNVCLHKNNLSTETCEKSISNRAVFTVVFND